MAFKMKNESPLPFKGSAFKAHHRDKDAPRVPKQPLNEPRPLINDTDISRFKKNIKGRTGKFQPSFSTQSFEKLSINEARLKKRKNP
tara:strand:+ start:394 stop:654 length:261 start_codon:yes stop_codon:yes gene_type:complete